MYSQLDVPWVFYWHLAEYCGKIQLGHMSSHTDIVNKTLFDAFMWEQSNILYPFHDS